MKRVMLLACLMLSLSGCAILRNPLFWRITVGSVIRAAYEAGGAERVEARIDCLEEKGRISPETAEKIKTAAQKGYDALQTRLAETGTEDLLVDDEMLGALEAE